MASSKAGCKSISTLIKVLDKVLCQVHHLTIHCLSVQRVGVGALDLERLDFFAYFLFIGGYSHQEEK